MSTALVVLALAGPAAIASIWAAHRISREWTAAAHETDVLADLEGQFAAADQFADLIAQLERQP
ncbi:hypothetical protein ACIRVF_08015 [Kitasatospora sp. NPDC101157]|uniref:hypothetical protein n=1 Tax=Kitasatospora sp. NPDC101157 TaxID=3364098 RepID=UPI0037FCD875